MPEKEVYTFQEDGFATDSSRLWVQPSSAVNIDITQSFTLCLWFQMFFLNMPRRGKSNLISMATQYSSNAFQIKMNSYINAGDLNGFYLVTAFNDEKLKAYLDLTQVFRLNKWFDVCVIFDRQDSADKLTLLFDNGQHKTESSIKLKSTSKRELSIVLGQDQDEFKGGFQAEQSFSGQMAELKFWQVALNETVLYNSSYSTHRALEPTLNPENVTVEKQNIELKSFVHQDVFIWPWITSYVYFRSACDVAGGKMPYVQTGDKIAAEWAKFKLIMAAFSIQIDHFTRNLILANVYDCKSQSFLNPYLEGNEDVDTNCDYRNTGHRASILIGRQYYENEFDVVDRSHKYGIGVCNLENNYFVIKGLCQDCSFSHLLDIEYYVHGIKNRWPHFRGWKRSHIYFDNSTNFWTLASLQYPDVFFQLVNKIDQFDPFGRNVWISKSKTVSSAMEGKPIVLTFSRCKHGFDFTCDSGHCIDIGQRCNNRFNCQDKSDELNCSVLSIPDYYNKKRLPNQMMENDKSHEKPVEIHSSLTINQIPFIDTFNLKFTISFYLTLTWIDPKLTFKHLTASGRNNMLSEEEMHQIWAPTIAFSNALQNIGIDTREGATGFINNDGTVLKTGYENANEALIYPGSSSPITLWIKHYSEFSCYFKLQLYPFDTQICTIKYMMDVHQTDEVLLVPPEEKRDPVQYIGKSLGDEYEYKGSFSHYGNDGLNYSVVTVMIVIARHAEYHVLNTFLQTFLLHGIGILTLFFEVDNFSDRIMVTLTTMLVVVTLTTSIQENLPKTSYLKLIDYWLLYSMVLLVIILIIHTIIARTLNQKKKITRPSTIRPVTNMFSDSTQKRANQINKMGLYFLILFSLIFHGIFWSVAGNALWQDVNQKVEDFKIENEL